MLMGLKCLQHLQQEQQRLFHLKQLYSLLILDVTGKVQFFLGRTGSRMQMLDLGEALRGNQLAGYGI